MTSLPLAKFNAPEGKRMKLLEGECRQGESSSVDSVKMTLEKKHFVGKGVGVGLLNNS
jgi:hypothetical protein